MDERMTKNCRTCANWAKPDGKRAMRDHAYKCNAPEPDIGEIKVASCYELCFSRRFMARDDGVGCPFWRKRATARASSLMDFNELYLRPQMMALAKAMKLAGAA